MKNLERVLSMSLDNTYRTYNEQPIPSDLDEGLVELVETYRSANPIRRFLLRRRVTAQHSDILWAFSERMASLGVRERSRQRLLQGLLALTLEGFKEDWRDSLMRLGPLHDAAVKIGVSPEDLFKEAASYARGKAARIILEYPYRKPDVRSAQAMGYKEAESSDGFRYVQRLGR